LARRLHRRRLHRALAVGALAPALEPLSMDREAFVDVIISYRRELWLWLIGERTWEQCISGLAGRVARRLPGH